MHVQSKLGKPDGVVMVHPVYGGMNEYDVLPTSEGGALELVLPDTWDKDEERESSVNCVVAIALDPKNDGEYRNALILTAVFADSTGRLWQVRERVACIALWKQAFATAECYDRSSPVPRPEHLLSMTDRVIFSDMRGLFDGRDRRMLLVTKMDASARDGFIRIVFPIREHMCGCSMTLIERVCEYRQRQPELQPTRHSSLALSLTMHTDSRSVAIVDQSDNPLSCDGIALADVSPIRCEAIVLSLTWRNRLGPAEEADAAAWRTALDEAGATKDEIAKLLSPNKYLIKK